MAVATESNGQEAEDLPPKVPPRTKRRPKSNPEPESKPNPEREVLVAVTRGSRERKAESRQRQPPAMLVRQASELEEKTGEPPVHHQLQKPRKGPHLLVLPPNKGPRLYGGPAHLHQPMRLIPVQPVSVTYGNWIRKVGPGDPEINSNILRRILANHVVLRQARVATGRGGYPAKIIGSPVTSTTNTNSNCNNGGSSNAKSVTRSGSLSSQGSIGSDSGNESRPKSALKKVRRASCEPKKCVTFNALTTVQVMEE